MVITCATGLPGMFVALKLCGELDVGDLITPLLGLRTGDICGLYGAIGDFCGGLVMAVVEGQWPGLGFVYEGESRYTWGEAGTHGGLTGICGNRSRCRHFARRF
jgi:hypothetical protein